ISRVLAQILNYKNPEDLVTVATLYNIGKLIIAVYFPDEHRQIVDLKKTEGLSSSMAEQRILGVTHAEVGALVLERYNIPQEICDAVRFHNRQDRGIASVTDDRLEHLAREAARIVRHFALPAEKELQQLAEQLRATITAGRTLYAHALDPRPEAQEYSQVFMQVLQQASDLVVRDLTAVWPPRDAWNQLQESSD
ncbi:MAG: HDOD domain-containing protein, partial [Desulfobacterales bacterium]